MIDNLPYPNQKVTQNVSLAAADVLQITAVAFELPPRPGVGCWNDSEPGPGGHDNQVPRTLVSNLKSTTAVFPVPIDRLGRRRPPTRGVTGKRLPPAGRAAQSATRGWEAGN
jgi:hypothetical protein